MEKNVDIGRRLKNTSIFDDTFLYHYTSISSACKILESKKLNLSNLINTNDPLEFSFSDSFEFEGLDVNYKKIRNDLLISQERRKNFVRILCFSKDIYCNKKDLDDGKQQNYTDNNLLKGWARCRMWAQYADNHNGVCLVFDKDKLRRAFIQLKVENDSITFLKDGEVEYTNNFKDFENAMTDINNTFNTYEEYKNFFLEDDRMCFLFKKCEDFRDESEYRFCLINRNLKSPGETMSLEYGDSLKAVIYGCKYDDKKKLQIPIAVKQYKIYWNHGIPELLHIK